MKLRLAEIVFLTFALFAYAQAQGVESPPVTSFRPDTSLPRVNVPEFVITGKAETELPMADKPSIEIDSSYFQAQSLAGLGIDVPMNHSLSAQGLEGGVSPSLFARASIGHYMTTDYLLSGGGGVNGYLLSGSLSGNYTSGFMPNTIQRSLSVQGGIAKDFEFDEVTRTRNSVDAAYSRTSYFLYGSVTPNLLRTTDHLKVGIQSDMDFGEVPLMAGLSFNRFSLEDAWKDVQSSVDLSLRTAFTLSSGNLSAAGSIRFGNHAINPPAPLGPLPAIDFYPWILESLDRSFFDLTAGAVYSNHLKGLSYSLSLNYFQYKDDLSNGVAKLYPDLQATYKVNGDVAVFARFYGNVEDPTLSGFLSTDHYVDATFPLRNTQHYANFILGGNVRFSDEVVMTPQISVEASKYYPIFVSGAGNESALAYANGATIYTASITAEYKKDKFNADATLNSRIATADSLSSIPNLPPFDLNVDASYQITPQFTGKAWFLFLSGRYSDLPLSNKLSAAWLLSFRLSYDLEIGEMPLEIFVEGRNLFDQKYYIWQGYQEFPLSLFIGISSKIL